MGLNNIFDIPLCIHCHKSGYDYPLFSYKENYLCFKCLKNEERILWNKLCIDYKILYNSDISFLDKKFKKYSSIIAYEKAQKYYEEYYNEHNRSEIENYNNKINELLKTKEQKVYKYNQKSKFIFFSIFILILINYKQFSSVIFILFLYSIVSFIIYIKYNPEKYFDDIIKNLNKPNILGKDINFIKNSELYHKILNDYDFKFEHYQNRFLKDTYTRKKVLKRDENTCQSCNKLFDESNLEAHHIIPKARGGDDKMINLVTLCIRCHDNEKWYGHRRAFKK